MLIHLNQKLYLPLLQYPRTVRSGRADRPQYKPGMSSRNTSVLCKFWKWTEDRPGVNGRLSAVENFGDMFLCRGSVLRVMTRGLSGRRSRTVRSSAEAHRRGRRRRLRQRFRVRFVSMSSSGHGKLILAIRFDMHGVYEALGHQWWDAMDGIWTLNEGTRRKGNSEGGSPATCRAWVKGHLLE